MLASVWSIDGIIFAGVVQFRWYQFDRDMVSGENDGMGRTHINDQSMTARFPEGTFERIDGVRVKAESRAEFIRAAVDREIRRREKAKPKDTK
jgi:hypothetical protein